MTISLNIVSGLELSCANFTGDKKTDCSYLTSQGFSYEDEQEALNILWEQGYDFDDTWEPSEPIEIIVPTIERTSFFNTSEMILFSKIFFFGLMNYVVFSLTKSSVVLKWLNAV